MLKKPCTPTIFNYFLGTLGGKKPWTPEGVKLDTTRDNRVVGIEILNASEKIPLTSLLSNEVDSELLKIPTGT